MAKNLRITITDEELAEILTYHKRLLRECLSYRTDLLVFDKHDSERILEYLKRIEHLTRMHMKHCENEYSRKTH